MDADGALELLRAGDPAGALALLGDQLSPDVIDPALLVARGMVQLANNHPAEALTALQMAVALGETAPPALLNLALAQEKTGDVVHALQLMETLERHLPDWDEPPLRLAEALRAAGRLHDAELAYGRVLNINPGREAALLGLSGLLILRGDGHAARELLLRCCGIAPGRADAWDALGLALLLTGDKPLAESAFAEAQRLAPQILEYALHRVDAASAAGSEDALLTWLEIAGDDDPLNATLPTARGVLLERLGRRPEAIDALEAATALAPDARLPAALLGGMLSRSNRLREAEVALRRASELDPDNLALRDARAMVLLRASVMPKRASNCSLRSNATASRRMRPVQPGQRHHLCGAAGRRGGSGPPRDRDCTRAMHGRDGRCATHCRIAMALPAQSCSRRSRIAPTGCRAKPCRRSTNTRRSRSATFHRSAVRFVQDASGRLADDCRFRDTGSRRLRNHLPGAERLAGLDGAPVPRGSHANGTTSIRLSDKALAEKGRANSASIF